MKTEQQDEKYNEQFIITAPYSYGYRKPVITKPRCLRCRIVVVAAPYHWTVFCPHCHKRLRTHARNGYRTLHRDNLEKAGKIHRY